MRVGRLKVVSTDAIGAGGKLGAEQVSATGGLVVVSVSAAGGIDAGLVPIVYQLHRCSWCFKEHFSQASI